MIFDKLTTLTFSTKSRVSISTIKFYNWNRTDPPEYLAFKIQEVVKFTYIQIMKGVEAKKSHISRRKLRRACLAETSRQVKDIQRVFDHTRPKISKRLHEESEVIEGISHKRVYP